MEMGMWGKALKAMSDEQVRDVTQAIQTLHKWELFRTEFKGFGIFALGVDIAYENERRRPDKGVDRFWNSDKYRFEDCYTQYTVVVGNIGTVFMTDHKGEAEARYETYICYSKRPYGRASGENVALMADGELLMEYQGSKADDASEQALIDIESKLE